MEERELGEIPSGRFSFMHLVAIAAIGLVLALTAWTFVQKRSVEKDLLTVESNVSDVQSQLDALAEKELDEVAIAQEVISDVEENSVVWSDTILHLLSVTPLDIYYRNYSAAADGAMSVSVLTDSYDSAAHLIAVLEDDDSFVDVFTSSLSLGNSSAGGDVVSFGLTFNVE
jgi:Tfp pilus assembly protein PilN